MRTLKSQWAEYRERVVPATAPAVQVLECRRAFYAGAECLLRAIMQGLDPGLEPTDADLSRMESIEAELSAFAADVTARRA